MRRRTVVGLAASALAVALVTGMSIVWPGLDAQDTPPKDASVWVLQSDGLRYARVNTAIGELDTVRSVANPTRIVQADTGAYMFTDSDSKVIRIDEAAPVDLDAQGLEQADSAPAGTREAVSAGDFVAYRTDTGAVYAGRLSTGSFARVDPFGSPDDEDRVPYTADAIAVDPEGMLFGYSSTADAVLRFDVVSSTVRGEDPVAADPDLPALTAAGEDWVLVDAGDGRFWARGADEGGQAPTQGAVVLSRPDPDGDAVYLADQSSLVRVGVDGGTEQIVPPGTTVRGTPARPVIRDGGVYAAWLPEGAGPGALWDAGRIRPLEYAGAELGPQRRPVFLDTGDALVLNDARSGWVWTVEDARLLPSSQRWDIEKVTETAAETSEEEPPAVIDPRPPVAVPDAFGVRPGALVPLPVLLNDHDPNEDVLAVDPTSVTGLDPGFGVLTTTDDRQRLAVRVASDARGTATFSYAVSDGTAEKGLTSEPASVTLTVAAEAANSAPVWCGVPGCRQSAVTPQLPRGGTLTLPVLTDWVDPEGDAMLLSSVVNTSGIGKVAWVPSGELVYQHSDATGRDESITLSYTVSDTHGASATRTLVIRVVGEPEPTVQSFAVVDIAGSRLTVDVAPHVTGAAGEMTLTAARVLDDAAATATVVGGTTQFDFSTTEPGTYRVALTVAVGGGEATGTARITLLPADAPAQLSTAPVIAFVRPQADATIDVFAAVSNPTRRVLLLSDVVAFPAPGATLSVDAVAQSQLRVSGTTATAEPGLLGTVAYRVSDGTNDEGASVEGLATVYLLPPPPEIAPIAVDDTVVVRAGSQVDIPVLANDFAPSGARPRIDPESVVSSSEGALAFASGDLLRYLAPTTPGTYTVEYDVFTTGSPTLTDTATVRIRALADDANRPPLPANLSGRVVSGLSSTIPFDGFGMDPDGDVVRLDRIVDQPDVGSAAISADGASIVYTSVAGDSGQHSFRYRVVDAAGATGEATVRVGVLTGDANPGPVTYTDYVHVQQGDGNVIHVRPLSNDLDPMRGKLTLTDVRPDVPAAAADGTPSEEYALLESRILSVTDDTVTIAAGTEPTTMAFLYDVESSSRNTARGLIVVRVVRERVPDYPIVADTVLTVEDREDFATGVDVLGGKVTWSGGEVDELALGLWRSPRGVEVDGDRLRGELTEQARIIPFSVTGQTSDGPVTTYAFLRLPAEADPPLTLRSGIPPLVVGEGEAETADMADLVARPRGTDLEIGDVRASGARAAAVCERVRGTTVRYTAGEGAPWTDACLVSVRLAGQGGWTVLPVPVTVTPLDPQPTLSPASMTVAPGESQTYDLGELTTWQGRAEAIEYRVEDTAASFDIELRGAVLTVAARDDARPGTSEYVTVEVLSHAGVPPARMILRVGAAPSVLPQGGTVQQLCSQSSGTQCTITVIGAAGEVNPLPSTPLEVVAVAPRGVCTGVTFTVASARTVTASWTADAPGATCAASFSVRDAQDRLSAGERDGAILLDLQGYPQAPASVVQSAYGDASLTLRVDPGAARSAYPALRGFEVRHGGVVVAQCTDAGVCPALTAPNGERREFEVVAVNAVGVSRTSVRTVAWAYDPPVPPRAVTAAPLVTSGEGGLVSLAITGVDASDTGSLQIASPAGETITVAVAEGQTAVTVPSFRVGANTATPITVTPRSRFEVPPVAGAAPVIESLTASASGIGAPVDLGLALTATAAGGGRTDVSAVGSASLNGDGSELRWGIVRDGQPCVASPGGRTAEFRGLPDGRLYTFVLCVESWFDGRSFGRSTTTAEVRAVQSTAAPEGFTFVVGPTPHVDGQRARWTIDSVPTSRETPPYDNVAAFRGYPSGVFDTDPGITVRYEHVSGWWQSAWGAVTPARGSAPYQVQARWWVDACNGGARLVPQAASTDSLARVDFTAVGMRYYDAAGAELAPGTDPWIVPDAAVRVTGIGVVVDWVERGWGLRPAAAEFSATCSPAPSPPPGD
ncbi:hypothetical protein FVP74_02820 [Microbacterium saccharophilum]|uniref:Tandem-95 repeat protein n=1 Tax=Microbacterium saccharophilum TaxID=1213358 RepID=A0A5C8I856_9MICO|nr:Ig-like domain-containing protein [Microbacterium saccharophilum]TXK15345.1 hypothetical protein FVP74_02820 [Microbacterium saccharophilum]GEP47051.1 fibronectin type III [Microbacterium saccharophilum]